MISRAPCWHGLGFSLDLCNLLPWTLSAETMVLFRCRVMFGRSLQMVLSQPHICLAVRSRTVPPLLAHMCLLILLPLHFHYRLALDHDLLSCPQYCYPPSDTHTPVYTDYVSTNPTCTFYS
ncbi:hypothetical protein L227DRAFT_146506 [Lentinus tigrinus ALCF2SS1-6]|uniref:Uncharacterized protein n=1 Tax=Lentinus tigrinus ALCF2SS1-6 TaxID=1328759 RepID=A0A5C2SSS9_9APHY|nr:hypothetical protein L227DRAFT_146506 [Lentinus tigrinus ALCF2SS1-6]